MDGLFPLKTRQQPLQLGQYGITLSSYGAARSGFCLTKEQLLSLPWWRSCAAFMGAPKSGPHRTGPKEMGPVKDLIRLLSLLGTLSQEDQVHWPDHLPTLLQMYNNTIHETTGPFDPPGVLTKAPQTEINNSNFANAEHPSSLFLPLTIVPTALAPPAGPVEDHVVAPAIAPSVSQGLRDEPFLQRSQRQNRGRPPDRYGH